MYVSLVLHSEWRKIQERMLVLLISELDLLLSFPRARKEEVTVTSFSDGQRDNFDIRAESFEINDSYVLHDPSVRARVRICTHISPGNVTKE